MMELYDLYILLVYSECSTIIGLFSVSVDNVSVSGSKSLEI